MPSFCPNTASRSRGIALNNAAIKLLRCCAWREAAKTLYTAVRLKQHSVRAETDIVSGDLEISIEYNVLSQAANNRFAECLATCQSHPHRLAPTEPACGRNNLFPVVIHDSSNEQLEYENDSSIAAESSMVMALDCAGVAAEYVYRLLQTASSLLSNTEPFRYNMLLVQLTERLLLTAQRLGLQQDCIELCKVKENLLLITRDYHALVQASSAPVA